MIFSNEIDGSRLRVPSESHILKELFINFPRTHKDEIFLNSFQSTKVPIKSLILNFNEAVVKPK